VLLRLVGLGSRIVVSGEAVFSFRKKIALSREETQWLCYSSPIPTNGICVGASGQKQWCHG
jgi:hypothetical protein